MKSKILGSILGSAIGDAFGLPYEFSNSVADDKLEKRSNAKGYWGYSDDTEMLIGLAESITSRSYFDPEHALNLMAANYEPARGYGKGMKYVFNHAAQTDDWKGAAYIAWQEGSKGNGACSRISPVACRFHGRENFKEMAMLSAKITHAHQESVMGSYLQAKAISYALGSTYQETVPADEFISYLLHDTSIKSSIYHEKLEYISHAIGVEKDSTVVHALGKGTLAVESVPLAIYLFARYGSQFDRAIVESVRNGGDTDTIAAMCGALSGAYCGIDRIPVLWLSNLEQGAKGKSYIEGLAVKIWESREDENG